jgi:hypothetical protein
MRSYLENEPRLTCAVIKTRYLPPDDDHGSGVSAECITTNHAGGHHWDYSLSVVENHLQAAINALEYTRSEWELLSFATTDDDDGWVFSFGLIRHQ